MTIPNTKHDAIIFGGSGFVGTHLSKYLLNNDLVGRVFVVDMKKPRFEHERLAYLPYDIRNPFDTKADNIEVVYNLAAVHTTPGYENHEYFEANIRAAENVCAFAGRHYIDRIVFTSSISPYGSSEDCKSEESLPQPTSAYGSSKLAAEYVHRCWLAGYNKRKLVIVRPGVVFGSGEDGNFVRLYKSLRKKYFFYPGRRDTKKACIYVKDLVRAMYEMAQSEEKFQLYNMCYPAAPTISSIVKAVAEVTHVSGHWPVIPGSFLKSAAYILKTLGLSNGSGIHPERVEKLMRSTNISGEKLAKSPYALRYDLRQAIEDWYQECDKKGLC